MTLDLALLTGPDAGDVLRAALAGAGGELLSWRAGQVDHQPGRSSTVSYRAQVRWDDGRTTDERLAACTGSAPAGTLLLESGADRVAVWRFPHDPSLPALPAALDEAAVAGLLRALGLSSGLVRLRVRAYRPRRRAVVEAVGEGGGRLFLKVVRPSRVRALHERHRLLTAHGVPAPQSLGWTPDGLLVLGALPGRTLRDALRAGSTPLPDGAAVLDLLDRLPSELADGPGRQSWLDRAPHYAAVVGASLPPVADRARELAAGITEVAGTGPLAAVHGDLYESQLLIGGGGIAGVLDVDTAGPGERLDDLACLLGHLSVLSQLNPQRAGAIDLLGSRYAAAFEQVVDPVDLRYRAAAVVLSLATGPHRVQEDGWQEATVRRLDLVEQWIDRARALTGGRA